MEIELPEIPDTSQLPEQGQAAFDKLAALELPSGEQIIDYLSGVGWLPAIMLIVCGVVYLAYGWKTFKMLVIINAGCVGILAGYYIGAEFSGAQGGRHMELIGGATGGILLAALAWPLMKYAVSIMGGLAGSFLGYGLWIYLTTILDRPGLTQYAWVGALIGLLVLGMLAFIIFRLTVIMFTCAQGAVMTVAGLLAVVMKYPPAAEELQTRNPHLLPLLVAVPAVIGFTIQYTSAIKADKKKRILAEKG